MATYTVEVTVAVWLHGEEGSRPVELLAIPAMLQRKIHTITRAIASGILVEANDIALSFDWTDADDAVPGG